MSVICKLSAIITPTRDADDRGVVCGCCRASVPSGRQGRGTTVPLGHSGNRQPTYGLNANPVVCTPAVTL
jgi:hypothetical protein